MEDGIFFNQSKYIKKMLKKFRLKDSKPTKMPMSIEIKLTKDNEADFMDSSKYQGMIGTKMPSEYQQDYKETRAYAPKIYNDPNMSNALRDVYRALESRYVHEGRTIDPSFYSDLSDDLVAKFKAIGFDCLLSLDEQICPRFIFEFYKTFKLERDSNNHLLIQFIINNHHFNPSLTQFAKLTHLPNQGICIYSDAWSLDELEKTLEQIEPYNSRLPALDDIRNLIHRRTVHEKVDKEGNTIHKLPNQIETNELFEHLRPCELVIRENVYSVIGNRYHTQAVIALMDRRDKVLPYGMILTRLFKNLKANMSQHPLDARYKLIPRKISSFKAKQPKKPHPKQTRNVGKSKRTQLSTSSSTESPPLDNGDLPSTKLSPRSYHRALKDDPNMSKEQRETRGMFKILGRALHNFARLNTKTKHTTPWLLIPIEEYK
ncbi:hypothetical protein Tco_0735478 [Tanacetum coccineum]